jgi:hypothetical protein
LGIQRPLLFGCAAQRYHPYLVGFTQNIDQQKQKSIDPRTPPVVPVALNLPAVAFGGAALLDAQRGLAGQAVLLGGF